MAERELDTQLGVDPDSVVHRVYIGRLPRLWCLHPRMRVRRGY